MSPKIAKEVLVLMWDGIKYQDGLNSSHSFPFGEIDDLEDEEAVEWLQSILNGNCFLDSKLDDRAMFQPVLRPNINRS